MITLLTKLSGFWADYSISIKLADFIVILSNIVFLTECLEPSDGALIVENRRVIISSIFQGIDEQRAYSIYIHLEAPPLN